MITVHLATALICFSGRCHPALVGADTPRGTYPIVHAATREPGYGGDVLAFARDAHGVYAIHRVWTRIPSERRAQRIQSVNAADRNQVTHGCINVTADVYDALVDCCSTDKLIIQN